MQFLLGMAPPFSVLTRKLTHHTTMATEVQRLPHAQDCLLAQTIYLFAGQRPIPVPSVCLAHT